MPSQVKMYACGLASSFHGKITMPTTPVISAPVRKLIAAARCWTGRKAGETTLAAMFTDRVATSTVTSAKEHERRCRTCAASATGSQIGLAVDRLRARGDEHGQEREQRHRRGQAEGLAPDLGALARAEAGEVRDVERQRGPEADHAHEGGEEDLPEVRCPSRGRTAGRAAGRSRPP